MLYVWGNNASSESALTDELINANKAYYVKGHMRKPIEQTQFTENIQQPAPGNVNSVFLCLN